LLSAHVVTSQPVQLLIDQGHQLVESGLVSVTPRKQQLGYIRRGWECHISFPQKKVNLGSSY
jgi:hypothetical protein